MNVMTPLPLPHPRLAPGSYLNKNLTIGTGQLCVGTGIVCAFIPFMLYFRSQLTWHRIGA